LRRAGWPGAGLWKVGVAGLLRLWGAGLRGEEFASMFAFSSLCGMLVEGREARAY